MGHWIWRSGTKNISVIFGPSLGPQMIICSLNILCVYFYFQRCFPGISRPTSPIDKRTISGQNKSRMSQLTLACPRTRLVTSRVRSQVQRRNMLFFSFISFIISPRKFQIRSFEVFPGKHHVTTLQNSLECDCYCWFPFQIHENSTQSMLLGHFLSSL